MLCKSCICNWNYTRYNTKYIYICIYIYSKLLVHNKKDADPHFQINSTDVSTCEKTIHLGNVLSTTDKYEMVFDGIKKFNCSVNRVMYEFGSLQIVIKNKLFHQYCYALYGSQLWPLWHTVA